MLRSDKTPINNSNDQKGTTSNTPTGPLWKQSHRERRLHQAQALRQSHLGSNMVYNCDVCGKAFGYLFSMKKHREKHAPFITGGSFQPSFAGEEHHLCMQCNRLFSCYASLKRHQLTTHTENGPVFHCPYCPYSNPFSWQVKRHIYKRHGYEDTYFCTGCKKFFKTDAEQAGHTCSAPLNNRYRHNHQQLSEQQVSNAAVFNNSNKDSNGSNVTGHNEELISVDDNSQQQTNESNQVQAAISGDSNGDTPCICSECGTCLPCFDAMVKHQASHQISAASNDNAKNNDAEMAPTPLISSSRLSRMQPFNFSMTTPETKQMEGVSSLLTMAAKLEPGATVTNNGNNNGNSVFSSPINSVAEQEALSPSASSPSPATVRLNEQNFQCSYCGISFTDPALWGLHSTMHDVNDLRKCNFCGRQAKDKYDFWRHFIDHSKLPTVSSMASPPISAAKSEITAGSTSVSSNEATSK